MEPALTLGHREAVVGVGEVVDADPAVAGGSKRRGNGLGLGVALGAAGKRVGVDAALVLLEARHVGVAEDGDAVRFERQALAHRLDRRGDRLVGQAVDQVEVDAADAGGAQPCRPRRRSAGSSAPG